MALIAKIDSPLTVSADRTAVIHARPYKKPTVVNGAEVFVWLSETAGGKALAARGQVLSGSVEQFPNKSGAGQHKELVLSIRIDNAEPKRALSLDQIVPHRDSGTGTPAGTLGKVLYKHALNKITSIESDVADFVRSHFEEE